MMPGVETKLPLTAGNPADFRLAANSSKGRGGAGASIGRNIFQHDDPEKMTRAIAAIVHNEVTVDEALTILS